MKRVLGFTLWPLLYTYNLVRSLDQIGCALLGQDIDWTISAWIGAQEMRKKPWAVLTAKVIGFFFRDPEHCFKARMADPCEGENSVGRMRERWLAGESLIHTHRRANG